MPQAMTAAAAQMRLHTVLKCVVPIKEQEVPPVLLGFASLFSILTSYFLLLPLREDAGISLGTSTLPLLFACSLFVTLIVTPAVTAYLNSRGHAAGRDAALRQFYNTMAMILLGFFILYNFSAVESWLDRINSQQHLQPYQQAHPLDDLQLQRHNPEYKQQQVQQRHLLGSSLPLTPSTDSAASGSLLTPSSSAAGNTNRAEPPHDMSSSSTSKHLLQAALTEDPHTPAAAASSSSSSNSSGSSSSSHTLSTRTGDPTLTKHQRLLRAAFYVWVNVMNLVGISCLWAKCADAFSPESGARLFGFISAGATLGQLAGSLIAMFTSWAAAALLDKVRANTDVSSSGISKTQGTPASSLLLLAAVLQLVAAQLVTRIRPVAGLVTSPAAGDGGQEPFAKDCSLNSGKVVSVNVGDRPGSPPSLVRRVGGSGGDVANNSRDGSAGVQGPAAAVAAAAVLMRNSSSAGGTRGPGSLQVSSQAGAAANSGGSSSSTNGFNDREGSSGGHKSAAPAGKFQLHKVLTGFQLIWRSPYLLLLCSNLLLTYVVGSLMYFQRALVVSAAAAVHGPAYRTAFFAALNTWSAAAILIMQLFATSSLLRWMGMSVALGLAPAICVVGLISIVSCPLPWMVAVSEVLRKVFAYAVLRPAREVLFTVVSREEKYSAKLVIDTLIQRLGDALAAAVFQLLDVKYSLGQAGIGAAGCLMCVVWIMIALALGRKHKQLAQQRAPL